MVRTLESEILEAGGLVTEDETIRSVAAMEPYVRHYARELQAFSDLQANPADFGFLARMYGPVSLPEHVIERKSSLQNSFVR